MFDVRLSCPMMIKGTVRHSLIQSVEWEAESECTAIALAHSDERGEPSVGGRWAIFDATAQAN